MKQAEHIYQSIMTALTDASDEGTDLAAGDLKILLVEDGLMSETSDIGTILDVFDLSTHIEDGHDIIDFPDFRSACAKEGKVKQLEDDLNFIAKEYWSGRYFDGVSLPSEKGDRLKAILDPRK